MVEKVRKRDGSIVDFDSVKITAALEKAISAVRGGTVQSELDALTLKVVKELDNTYRGTIADMEGVQDIVEQVLMGSGYYDVAKAYILYRERHAQIRSEKQDEIFQKIEENRLSIIDRDGKKVNFSEQLLRNYIAQACKGYEGVVNVEDILRSVEASLYDNIPTGELSNLVVMTTRGLIEINPIYDVVTARMFLSTMYREVIGAHIRVEERAAYSEAFVKNMRQGVAIGRLDKAIGEFDLESLSKRLDPIRDEMIPYRGLQTLYDRYFTYDHGAEKHLETPQMFWMRVAMGLAINEPDRNAAAARFYDVLSKLEFVSSTPTLFHSGTAYPQMSSCYLTTVQDDLYDIFKAYSDNAQLSKWSGGLGNDWSNIRATGAFIKSTGVESQGVIPFLKISNDVTVAINRSGKRRGATCAYLEAWHLDVEDFIDLRRNTGDERRRTHDMSTAIWIPDLLLKRVQEDGKWTLFSPHEVPELHHTFGSMFERRYAEYEKMAAEGKLQMHKTVKAKDIWRHMLTQLFETGHPWITFKDPSNIRSPQDHVGVVHNSNLCTEITLNTSKDETAVCNLGSVNMARHVSKGQLDMRKLEETVKTGMRMLDNVIDLNAYPTVEAKNSNMRHRPVGLGIMGFQDALYQLDINFDSEEAVKFADQSMEAIAYYAIMASAELAKEKGSYQTYKGSKWDRGVFPQDTLDILEKERGIKINVPRGGTLDWTPVREAVRNYGMRNSNCMAIAPTATISNIAGCFPSIEPIYNEVYVKSNMSGDFTVVNRYLVEDLKKVGLWSKRMLEEIKNHDGSIQQINSIPTKLKEKYKNAFEIEPEWLIRIAAYRGKWIDQSQSLNIFTATSSGKRLSDIYLYAWAMGLKTTYYLRTLGASGIEKSTVDITKQKTRAEAEPITVASPVVIQKIQPMPEPQVPADVGSEVKACKIEDPDCEACQ
jgi:ribonucleoside-diphosphate reductase alpha chain